MKLRRLSRNSPETLAAELKKLRIQIDYVIEGGAHDGINSLELINNFPQAKVVLIEPDSAWRDFLTSLVDTDNFFPYALSDAEGEFELLSPFKDGSKSGNLIIQPSENIQLHSFGKCSSITLDKLNLPNKQGLLWLNIMGSTYPALLGDKKTIQGTAVAALNVNYREMYPGRPSNFIKVAGLLAKQGFLPIYIDLDRRNFGWIVFVQNRFLSRVNRLNSSLLLCVGFILHITYKIFPAKLG